MVGWNFQTRSLRPIGLDIGHNSIKMIQLLANGNVMSVIAAHKVRIDPGVNGDEQRRRDFVVSAIKQVMAKGNFRGRNVVSCLPNDRLKITSLRLPETENVEVELALKKEAAQRFGLDPEKDSIDYIFAGNVRQGDEVKNELILFAAGNESIKSHIDMLEQAQLRPVAIDTVAGALFRSFERFLRRQEDKERTVVFVDIGSRFTTVVFGRGGEITFVKQIPFGGEKFNQEIAVALGVNVSEAEMLRGLLRAERELTPAQPGSGQQAAVTGHRGLDELTRQVVLDTISRIAEDIAREISLCFRYYTVTFRGKRVEQAIFAGGEAYETILLNVLKRQLTVEVEVAQPLRGIDLSREGNTVNFDSDRRGLLCEWAVAVGLGLKGWNGKKATAKES